MSAKQKQNGSVDTPESRRAATLAYRKKIMETDPYWQEPLPYRIYYRLMFAVVGGIMVGCGFDVLGAPFWLQCTMSVVSGLGILLFRMAYPAGIGGWWNGLMDMALEEAEKQGTQNDAGRKAKGGLKK